MSEYHKIETLYEQKVRDALTKVRRLIPWRSEYEPIMRDLEAALSGASEEHRMDEQKLRELIAKWRESIPQGIIGPWSQAVSDCADELEAALADTGAGQAIPRHYIRFTSADEQQRASAILAGHKAGAAALAESGAGLASMLLSQKCIWSASLQDWVAPNKQTHDNLVALFNRLASPAAPELSAEQVRDKADKWIVEHERDFYPLTNRPALATAITKFVVALLRSKAGCQ